MHDKQTSVSPLRLYLILTLAFVYCFTLLWCYEIERSQPFRVAGPKHSRRQASHSSYHRPYVRSASPIVTSTTKSWTLRSSSSSPQTSLQQRPIRLDPDNLLNLNEIRSKTQFVHEDWYQSYDRGINLWRKLQEAQRTLPDEDLAIITPTWEVFRGEPDINQLHTIYCEQGRLFSNVDNLSSAQRPASATSLCDTKGWYWIIMQTHQSIPPELTNSFLYSNWYNSKSRAIVALNNRGRIEPHTFNYIDRDSVSRAKLQNDLALPPSNWPRAPNSWAETTFAGWEWTCNETGRPISELTYVARIAIYNSFTRNVAYVAALNDDRTKHAPANADVHLEYHVEDPDFYAFLGSPNGVGVAELLTKYASWFATKADNGDKVASVKTISAVHVDIRLGMHLAFVFVFDDITPPTSSDTAKPPSNSTTFPMPSPLGTSSYAAR